MDEYMRSKLPEELRADKDVEARACSFLHLLCGAEMLIACHLVLCTVFLLFAPHLLVATSAVGGNNGPDSVYSSSSSSSTFLLFFSHNFFFFFSSTFNSYFATSYPSTPPSLYSSSSSSSSSSSLITGYSSSCYSSSCSTSSISVASPSSFSALHVSTQTAAVMVTVSGVALVVHAAIVCLLLRTRSLRAAMTVYLLYLDLNFILWCISDGRGVHSSGFLGFSILTLWTSFVLGIPAGLASLGLMLVQAGVFHVFTPVVPYGPHDEGAEGRLMMLVAISLSAILLKKFSEDAKGRIQQKNDQLKAGSEARTKFFNSVSHELRTPMHGIIAMSDELMKMPSLERCAQEAAEIVNECADHLLSLLDNILDFARIESGKLEFENVLFDLPFKMGKTVTLLAAHAKNKQIVLDVTSEMTDPHRVGDSVRVRQILFNLLSNAIKFTPPGNRITLHFCDKQVANPGQGEPAELEEGLVFFRVTDTGIGIAEEQLDRLFKSFSQVDKSISRKFGGTGLGLAICKHLTHGMGGQIGVHSVHGQGSTFWFTASLPAAVPWPYRQKIETEKRERERDEGRLVLQGRRVLVIDDNALNQKVAVKMLSSVGCKVTVASSGASALDILRTSEEWTEPATFGGVDEIVDLYDDEVADWLTRAPVQHKHGFDAILCDIEMPGLDGFGTAVRIRELERRDDDGRGRRWRARPTPVIALSAFHSEEYRNRCRESGMDDYLCKPVKKETLVSCLTKWCDDPPALWQVVTATTGDLGSKDGGEEGVPSREADHSGVPVMLAGGSGAVPFDCVRTG